MRNFKPIDMRLIDSFLTVAPVVRIAQQLDFAAGFPGVELVRPRPQRIAIIVSIELIAKFFHFVGQFRRILRKIAHGNPLQKVLRIVVVARQQNDAAEHAFVEKVGLLGYETNRVGIEKLSVDERIEIHPQKRRIDERTLDRLDAEKHVFAGQRTTVLKASVFANFECVGELILGDLRARLGDIAA